MVILKFAQVIQILLKAKLLTAAVDDENELTPLSTVELFTGYKKCAYFYPLLILFLIINLFVYLFIWQQKIAGQY